MSHRPPRPRAGYRLRPAPSRQDDAGRIAALEAALTAERAARQLAEQELRRQRRLAQILERAPALVYSFDLHDPDGSLYMSPYLEELLGYSFAEWAEVPNRWDTLVHPEDYAEARAQLDRARASIEPAVLEYRIRHRDGHYLWVQDEAGLIADEAGQPVAFQGFVMSIGKRKHFERALRAAETTYRSLADSLPDGIARLDRDLRITYLNPAAAALLPLPAEQLLGRHYHEIGLSAHLIEAWGDGLHRVLATGAPSNREVVLPTPSGERVLEARSIPELDAAGELVGILGLTRDITEQRAAEQVLRTSEERLRTVLSGMPIMLDAFDDTNRLVMWNAECERVTGYTAGELLGTDEVLARLYPDKAYRDQMLAEWARLGPSFRNWELTLVRKGGERRTVSWSNVSGLLSIPGWSFWAVGVDVTEQRAAEIALRESEERLRLAIDMGSMFAFDVELPSRRLFFSAVSSQITGISPLSPPITLEDSMHRDVHPEDRARAVALWERAIAERSGFEYEVRFRVSSGAYRWGFVRTRYMPGEAGRPDRITGVLLDITERHAMEEALRQRESQLRALNAELEQRVAERTAELEQANGALAESQHFLARMMDAVPVEVYLFDHRSHQLNYSNRTIQLLLGYAPEEANWFDPYPIRHLMHPDDWARVAAIDSAYERMSDSDVFVNEYRLRAADGSWRWFASRDVVFARDAAGRPAQMLGSAIDITERQEAESRLARAFSRLEELNVDLVHNSDLLRTIVDGINDGLALLDGSGTVVMSNQHLANLYRRAGVPLGTRWETVCPPSATLAARAIAEQRPVADRFTLERPDAGALVIEARALPVAGGAPAEQVVLHLVDITERLQLEAAVIQNERLATGGRIAAIVAHEVNSPLQAIQNFLFLAASDDPAERDTYLHLTAEEIHRIGGLIRRLLDLHFPEEGLPQELDLNGLVERVLQLTSGTLARHRVAVVRELAPELPQVVARADQLIQVLLNLFLNAVDAMTGGGTLTIRTAVAPDDMDRRHERHPDAVVVEVRDTGSGMTPELLTRIFEPFVTTKATGTGLGLAICRQIVEQAGGTLAATSAVGRGSTFTIRLPRQGSSLR